MIPLRSENSVGFLPMAFTKMSGAGNTFAVASTLANTPWNDFEKQIGMPRAELARLVCGKVLGLATDGFLLLEQGSGDIDYRWDFYNSDGSTAEMCGNAARCAARYCYEVIEGKQRSHFRFMTGAGPIEAVILGNDEIRVQMTECRWVQREIVLATKANPETFKLVNTGVPHLVLKLHDIALAAELKEMAREVRHHQDLQPEGANVTFYSADANDKIKAVTFERGVEDFTLACGTGAVAAAFVHAEETKARQVEITMPGGHMRAIFPENSKMPFLEGDAVFVGDFKYSLEVFL